MTQVSFGLVMDLPEKYARFLLESRYELDCHQSFQVLQLLLQEIDLSRLPDATSEQAPSPVSA